MLEHINPYQLLFIDIETAPEQPSFQLLSEAKQLLWAQKHSYLNAGDETAEDGYLKRAGVYAEFAKVICIVIGYIHADSITGSHTLRLKTFAQNDEAALLLEFARLVEKRFNDPDRIHFCGHNIREFDIPFLCRRMLINNINLPAILDRSGKRPWQMDDVDTLQLWKFGDYKHYTSLKLLTEILGVPTSKDGIEGKDVCAVYWQENGLDRIARYCRKDVVAVVRLLLRFKGASFTINDHDIIEV